MRATGALAAQAPPSIEQSTALLDDLTCANAGITPGASIEVSTSDAPPATSITVAGPSEDDLQIEPKAVRIALLGKIVTPGDRVSFLPQDFVRPEGQGGLYLDALVHVMSRTYGSDWQTKVFKVIDASPPGLVSVAANTEVSWEGRETPAEPPSEEVSGAAPAGLSLEELPGHEDEIESLRELLDLGFEEINVHHVGQDQSDFIDAFGEHVLPKLAT